MKKQILLCSLIGLIPMVSTAQEKIHLWENGAPGFEDRKDIPEEAASYWVKNVHNPSITVFLPPKDKATGAAVLICPGGGHRELGFVPEGIQTAGFFNSKGIAAFALKYRLAGEPDSPYKVREHPKQDAQRAMRLIRSRAEEWGVDPNRIGVMGFSAGGDVTSMISYDSGEGDPDAADPIDRLNYHPNFHVLIYGGDIGTPEELPENAPPIFILVANDDRGKARTGLNLLEKYQRARLPAEAHFYARGGHAFNMGNRSRLNTISTWPERMVDWMADNNILDPDVPPVEPQRQRRAGRPAGQPNQ